MYFALTIHKTNDVAIVRSTVVAEEREAAIPSPTPPDTNMKTIAEREVMVPWVDSKSGEPESERSKK